MKGQHKLPIKEVLAFLDSTEDGNVDSELVANQLPIRAVNGGK